MANLARRFYSYCNVRFGLGQALKSVGDGRKDPDYPLDGLLWKTIAGIVMRMPSFNQMEEAVGRGTFDMIGGRGRPKGDVFPRAFQVLVQKDLVDVADGVIEKARYNKALDGVTIDGFRVVAIDGTGLFSTKSPRLGRESHDRRGVHGEEIKEDIYLELAVAVSYVGGSGPKLLLALERIPKGEGETTMGRRELCRLFQRHCRFCDFVTVDALFAGGPFLNEVLAQNKECVVRVKREDMHIIRDAEALFVQRDADVRYENVKLRRDDVRYDVEIWEDEHFTSWEQVNRPLRCLRIRETRKTVNAAGKVLKAETVTTHLVTSAVKDTASALTIWKMAHYRWDVENTGFHVLKHHFNLEHAYGYAPEVIQTMLTLFVITYNLFMLFVHRNLRKWKTFLGVMEAIRDGLVRLDVPLWKLEPFPAPR